MRNVHLVLACCAFLFTLPNAFLAQPSQIGFNNWIGAAHSGSNDEQHLITYAQSISSGIPEIGAIRLQTNGQQNYTTLFTKGIPLGFDVLPLGDGYLAIASFFQCDIILNFKVYRLDWNGNTIWTAEPGLTASFNDTLKILPGAGATFWIFREGQLPELYSTTDGSFINHGPFILPIFRDFLKTADQYLLTYGSSGLARYTPNLQSLQFGLTKTSLLSAVELPGNRYATVSSDSLYLLDADLNVFNKTALNLPAGIALDLAYSNGLLQLLASTTPRQIIQYDIATLNLLQTLSIPSIAPFQPEFIWTNVSDQLVLAGVEHPLPNTDAQVLEVRTVPAGSMPDFDATADASLDEIYMPSTPKGKMLGNPAPGYSITVDSVSVRVSNHSSATLEQITVNGILNAFNWHCGLQRDLYRKTFTGLHLAPGASVELELGTLYWARPSAGLPSSVTLCFWTTLPNDSLDADFTNNRSCQTVPVIVRTNSPTPEIGALSIQPNPAGEWAIFEWENPDFATAQIRVFDAAGALITDQQIWGKYWKFQRGKLAAGWYTVLIRNEAGRLFSGQMMLK